MSNLRESLANIITGAKNSILAGGSNRIIFPPEYASEEMEQNTTFIVFSCIPNPIDRGDSSAPQDVNIWMPAPANLAWNDGMTPGDHTKSALLEGVRGMIGSLFRGTLREDASSATEKISGSDLLKGAGVALKSKLGMFGERALYEGRIIQNPNTRSTFSGHPVRQFSFNFKFTPRNENEARIIRQLIRSFTRNIYARPSLSTGSASFVLNYPPTWQINFIHRGRDNEFIPRIYESFLTSCASTLNSEGSFWHEDGSPKSIDITLTFQETRTLDRDIYDKMEAGEENQVIPDPSDGIVNRDWVTRLKNAGNISNIRGNVSNLRSRQ